jgi:hypothetical protein
MDRKCNGLNRGGSGKMLLQTLEANKPFMVANIRHFFIQQIILP